MQRNVFSRYAVSRVCSIDEKKSGGSPTTKRKREDDGDEAPATKGRKGADKSKLDFEKLITEAELDMKVIPDPPVGLIRLS